MKIDLYGDGIGSVELIQSMGEDITIVNAARVSFGKQKEVMDAKDKKLVKYLIKHRHTSTLEHNVITFRFVVPLFIRSQHHRHRTWSFNEISRRYTAEDIKFYQPAEFRTQSKSNRQASNLNENLNPVIWPDLSDPDHGITASEAVANHHKSSMELYNKLMTSGVCREQARGVLPQNMYTQYFGTCNLNNLIKFVSLRTHAGAQWEIQRVALGCLEIAESLWPVTIKSYREIKNLPKT